MSSTSVYKSQSGVIAVLVPTRNRSDLAVQAIRSLLQVEADAGIRIFVSDNSTSIDQVAEVRTFVDSQCQGRVTLMRPPHPMSMQEHWEWAVLEVLKVDEVASVTCLTDRMIARPDLFAEAARLARKYPTDIVSFSYDTIADDQSPICYRPTLRSGRTFRVDSKSLIRSCSLMHFYTCTPRVLNCFVPRSHFQKLADRFGGLFSSISLDYFFCFRTLLCVDSFVYLDKSVLVSYGLDRSNGQSTLRGRETEAQKDFVKELGKAVTFEGTPLPHVVTVGNAIAYEYLRVRSETGALEMPDIDRRAYLDFLASECSGFESPAMALRTMEQVRSAGWTPRRNIIGGLRRQLEKVLLWAMSRHFDSVEDARIYASTHPAPAIPWLHRLTRSYAAVEIETD